MYLQFLQEKQPQLLEDVHLEKRGHMKVCLMIVFLGVDAHNWPGRTPHFSSMDYLRMRMDERNGLQHEGNMRHLLVTLWIRQTTPETVTRSCNEQQVLLTDQQ
jgi:hypothetical protein